MKIFHLEQAPDPKHIVKLQTCHSVLVLLSHRRSHKRVCFGDSSLQSKLMLAHSWQPPYAFWSSAVEVEPEFYRICFYVLYCCGVWGLNWPQNWFYHVTQHHTLFFCHVSGIRSLYVINAPHLGGVNWFGATHAPEVTGSCAKTGFLWRGVVIAGARVHRYTRYRKAFVPMLRSLQSLSSLKVRSYTKRRSI